MPLLENKFVRFGLFGLGAFITLVVSLVVFQTLFGGVGFNNTGYNKQAFFEPGYGGVYMDEIAMEESVAMAPSMGRAMDGNYADDMLSSYRPEPVMVPVPQPDGYTSGLERYETTSYNLHANSRKFENHCETLTNLKAEEAIHFKYINTNVNNCNARFFVEEDRVAGVLSQFESSSDVTISRNTESVTRHKENLDNQSNIVRQQLASVERTLAEAEVAYDEIVTFARSNKDAATLSEAIREKLQQIDYLTQRKISLTSQLSNYAQQSADLSERLNVVEFYANFSRSNPVQVGEHSRMWERAWEDLSDKFTQTLIGLTAFFGIFLLYVVQYGLYLLVLIFAARFVWKAARKIWRL